MMDQLLSAVSARHPLTERDCGDYAAMKINGMRFSIRAFQAEGLGSVSAMTATGFFGLMKMDTLIITPTQLDLPLFSYDRVLAMGNDTLILELYDTLLSPLELGALERVGSSCQDLPDHDLGSHWYDGIKLPQSMAKKGKKAQTPAFDRAAQDYLEAYLALPAAPCAAAPKREQASVYVEGLLTHGGPSTDVFKKALGTEKTAELFRNFLFSTAR